ncbi:DUF2934 domain-containing protein [Ollibium composti]|uniref:DUF2934 domain-containing protein n=1 Tax=Ollibium composti TaxID=2675109 RepID=A0ABY2Q9P7_9HYPH|nr:DUF2934 domain-containing protein [Mesorhizobium composti]THF57427.1 DUF2934 domain-containing protein [Mesorhizobium composti]
MADDRHERIRQRAHAIWEREGRRDGDHERHWHQAAGEIDAEDAAAAKPGRKPATPRKPAAAKPKTAQVKATAAKTVKPAVAAKPRARKAKAG